MAGFSTYQANKILTDELVTPYASRYLALFIADPTDANLTANEVTGGWYTRKATGSWDAPAAGSTANSQTIQYNAVTGSQVTVTHWGIYDASTSGNLLFSDAFAASKTFNVDDIPFLSPGDLAITLL